MPAHFGSLSPWYARIHRDLAAGLYTFDEVEGFKGEDFLWSALEDKHLLDEKSGTLVVQIKK